MRSEDITTWAREQGAYDGPATVVHQTPWSVVVRIDAPGGAVFAKQASPGTAYEARLLRALAAYDAPHVLLPLATDVEHGRLLLPDGGRTLRAVAPTLDRWEQVLRDHAVLQRSLERRALPGCEDLSPASLPALYDDLLGQLDVGPRAELEALRPRLRSWCDDLASSGVPPTLQHDDLHDGNVFSSGLAFDWGDSALAFPFSVLLVALRSVASRLDLEPGGPELARLRDAYLEPWTDLHTRTELELLALLSTRVGKVARSRAWLRALSGVADPGEHREAPPGWLEELLEPDVF